MAGVLADDVGVDLAVQVANAVGGGDRISRLEYRGDVVALVLSLIGAGELLGERALRAEAESAGVEGDDGPGPRAGPWGRWDSDRARDRDLGAVHVGRDVPYLPRLHRDAAGNLRQRDRLAGQQLSGRTGHRGRRGID